MEETIYEVLNKINEQGYKAYLVGGYVRDYLRKKKTKDIDICTNAKPKELMEIFKDYQPISLDYGNIILGIKEFTFEITTFRKEITYKDNRKPEKIEYINNLEEDLPRRDFTINSICMDKDKKIIDLLNGKKDLNKKIIRSIGSADAKLKEDSLRIMRAIRFATVLNFKLDKELVIAIKNNKELLRKLSYERKKEELTKIFASENKKYGIKLLKELDLLDVLELKNIEMVLLTKDLLGMWTTIITNDNYPFTKNEKELMKDIKLLLNENMNDNFVLYKYGLYSISVVSDLKKLSKKRIVDRYNKLAIKDRKEINITTEEICKILNVEPGPFLKDLYDDIESAIIAKKLKNENNDIKNYILKMLHMV